MKYLTRCTTASSQILKQQTAIRNISKFRKACGKVGRQWFQCDLIHRGLRFGRGAAASSFGVGRRWYAMIECPRTNGPVAQRQSRGLIIPWSQVRILAGPDFFWRSGIYLFNKSSRSSITRTLLNPFKTTEAEMEKRSESENLKRKQDPPQAAYLF